MDIRKILEMTHTPIPYQPGEEHFWDDPHIAKGMLRAHLDPGWDAASYQHCTIDAICRYLIHALPLTKGAHVLDLGCGPGLYCERLAEAGMQVTGLDLSASSLAYARGQAAKKALPIRYVQGDYRTPFGIDNQDAILLIYEDYGVLSPQDRQTLLRNIFDSLKPGGFLALDVCSLAAWHRAKAAPHTRWAAEDSGFWRPHPHLWLEQVFFFEQEHAACTQVTVVDEGITTYRIHQTYFTPERITTELASAGFAVRDQLADLTGTPWDPQTDSPRIALVCRKAS